MQVDTIIKEWLKDSYYEHGLEFKVKSATSRLDELIACVDVERDHILVHINSLAITRVFEDAFIMETRGSDIATMARERLADDDYELFQQYTGFIKYLLDAWEKEIQEKGLSNTVKRVCTGYTDNASGFRAIQVIQEDRSADEYQMFHVLPY